MMSNLDIMLERLIKEGVITKEEFNKKVEQYKALPSNMKNQVDELNVKSESLVEKLKTDIERYEEANLDTVDLEELKTLKINMLNQQCNETILGTFESLDKVFKFDYEAQTNFTQMLLIMQLNNLTTIQWKTEDNVVNNFTATEFGQIVQDANVHKMTNISKYWNLKQQVLDAETKEEVIAIVW